MIDIRHLGADDIERDFDVAAPVRTHSPGSDARFGLRAILPQAQSPAVRPALGARSAMEVTLSRKRAKTQTRGRKLHSTEAKARIARARKTRAELEQELKASRREIAHARERLAEATMQQTATSEMLRLIANSPSDVQSVLDAVAEHAARLCDASNARIWRLEDNVLRLVASYGEGSATMDGREGLPADRDTVTGRAACDRRTIHVHDIAAEDSEYPLGSRIVKGQGWHTTLAMPLLCEGSPIGVILVRRREIRPFYDRQIALLEIFADQAAIAIENVRLFEAEKQRTKALARANRDLADREAKIRRLVDSNIIGIFITGLKGLVLEANDAFLRLVGHDRDDLVSGRICWTDLTPPEWCERDKRALAELSSNTIAQPYEKEFFRKDGSRVPVLIGGALFEEGGNEGVAFVLDLTERKRAEEALREREAKIRRLVDSNIIGIHIWDFDGRILEANDEFLRMVSYNREDLLAGRIRWADLTPPDWRDTNNARIAQQKSSGRFEPFEKEYTRKDGSRVPVLIGGATFEEGGSQGVAYVLDLTERKRAEEALRESEYKLRQIIETVPSLLWSADPNGEPTHINQRMVDYSGMRFEDFKQGGWHAFLHPDDLPETVRAFSHAIQTGTSYQRASRLRRADGEFRWHDTRGEPLRDQQGRIIQWYGLSVDIDEGKKAEDRLRRSEGYLAEAQRLSHSGVAAYNETATLYGSEEIYRIWGFDPAQGAPSREAVFQRIHPGDRDQLNAEVQRAVREKRDYSAAYRIVLPDGTVKHLEVIGRPAFAASGELFEIVTTQIDVTERKRAEEAIRESEAKFRDYAETASDWFWEIGPDYKYTMLTENAFGSHAADRVGTFWRDHALDLETEPEKWRLVWATLDSRKPFRDFVYCSLGGNGSPMHVRASGKPVFDANGEFRGYRGTGTDVTALRTIEAEARENEQRYRKAELELAHANRVATMGQLTSSIAHEVNQPITAAVTYALAARRWLSADPPNFREVDEALSLIVKEGNRAGEVVGRIRALIKKVPALADTVAINDTILEVLALTRTQAANNGVSVRTQLAAGLPPVQGDRVQLQQVLLNLIMNAIEAMHDIGEQERELLISTRNEPDGVSVEVRDSGPGFAPADLERVFEAFYTTKPGGLGLGLSICRSIIEAHNGRLWASPNVPRGAIFGFIAPAHPPAAS
jgi:PAS domain S-box-containing protein